MKDYSRRRSLFIERVEPTKDGKLIIYYNFGEIGKLEDTEENRRLLEEQQKSQLKEYCKLQKKRKLSFFTISNGICMMIHIIIFLIGGNLINIMGAFFFGTACLLQSYPSLSNLPFEIDAKKHLYFLENEQAFKQLENVVTYNFQGVNQKTIDKLEKALPGTPPINLGCLDDYSKKELIAIRQNLVSIPAETEGKKPYHR